MIKQFVEIRRDVLEQTDDVENLPLHTICCHNDGWKQDADALLAIIRYLAMQYPEAVRSINNIGFLPVNYATGQTLEITQFLVELYPASLSTQSDSFLSLVPAKMAALTLSNFCMTNTLKLSNKAQEKNLLHLPLCSERDVQAKSLFPATEKS